MLRSLKVLGFPVRPKKLVIPLNHPCLIRKFRSMYPQSLLRHVLIPKRRPLTAANMAKLAVFVLIAKLLQPFLKLYQTDAPMIPFLYNDLESMT